MNRFWGTVHVPVLRAEAPKLLRYLFCAIRQHFNVYYDSKGIHNRNNPRIKKITKITLFWNRPISFSQEKWPAACRRWRRAQALSRIVRCCHCFCIQAIIWKGFERTKLTLESSLWLQAFCSVPCCRVEWNVRISRRGRECYDRSNSIQNTKGTFETYAVNEVLIYFVMISCEKIL